MPTGSSSQHQRWVCFFTIISIIYEAGEIWEVTGRSILHLEKLDCMYTGWAFSFTGWIPCIYDAINIKVLQRDANQTG